MDISRITSLLQAIPIFSDLEEDELLDVLRIAQPVEYAAGHVICREGDPGDCMYVIQAGEVNVVIRGQGGQEVPLATLKSGELLGEMTLVDAQPRSADVIAGTDVRLCRMDRTAFDAMRSELHPAVFKMMRRIGLSTCARLRRVNQTVSRVVGATDAAPIARSSGQVRTRQSAGQGGEAEQTKKFWSGLMDKLRG